MDDLFQDTLLDLYRHPHNKKILENPSLTHQENNPVCGDQVELFLKFDGEKLVDVGWQGTGCTISQVGTSLLTDFIKDKTKTELKNLTAAEVKKLLDIELNATRLRCYLLGLMALQKTLKQHVPGT